MQAKSVCRPSSREMSTLEKLRPGIRPRFLSQKMAQKLCVGEGRGCRELCCRVCSGKGERVAQHVFIVRVRWIDAKLP